MAQRARRHGAIHAAAAAVSRWRVDCCIAQLLPESFISAIICDSAGDPIDATNRRRHPNRRQKRLVKERDKTCIDCGHNDLLHYDHVPDHEQTGHTITITIQLRLRCAPCHHARHRRQR